MSLTSMQLVQYVVVRGDLLRLLSWPTGAVIAQACHASTAALWSHRDDPNTIKYTSELDNMRKVVLEVRFFFACSKCFAFNNLIQLNTHTTDLICKLLPLVLALTKTQVVLSSYLSEQVSEVYVDDNHNHHHHHHHHHCSKSEMLSETTRKFTGQPVFVNIKSLVA